jgi:hypothetical protein
MTNKIQDSAAILQAYFGVQKKQSKLILFRTAQQLMHNATVNCFVMT